MYLNEKAWETPQEDIYTIDSAIKNFLDVYAAVKKSYPSREIYISEKEAIYLRSANYPLEKWLALADIEYKRLFASFMQKAIRFCPEDEFEVTYEGEALQGGTEAYLNSSFMVSICLEDKWRTENVNGNFFSLKDNEEKPVLIKNVFCEEQLSTKVIKEILDTGISYKIYTYEELWERRKKLFPHLYFCPSVEEDFGVLESFYLNQIMRKLKELENYCVKYAGVKFNPTQLTKTTTESKVTMKKYKDEHTFMDEEGAMHIVSWHMRFTGIPGRIFFVPEYKQGGILVCYIGKKLPNVTYPT